MVSKSLTQRRRGRLAAQALAHVEKTGWKSTLEDSKIYADDSAATVLGADDGFGADGGFDDGFGGGIGSGFDEGFDDGGVMPAAGVAVLVRSVCSKSHLTRSLKSSA